MRPRPPRGAEVTAPGPLDINILAARAKARLGQALSAAQLAEGHLQVVGVGDLKPTSTRPAWNAEPRLTEDDT
jgi:hypothetical protein